MCNEFRENNKGRIWVQCNEIPEPQWLSVMRSTLCHFFADRRVLLSMPAWASSPNIQLRSNVLATIYSVCQPKRWKMGDWGIDRCGQHYPWPLQMIIMFKHHWQECHGQQHHWPLMSSASATTLHSTPKPSANSPQKWDFSQKMNKGRVFRFIVIADVASGGFAAKLLRVAVMVNYGKMEHSLSLPLLISFPWPPLL
jgi:hypothetical protein